MTLFENDLVIYEKMLMKMMPEADDTLGTHALSVNYETNVSKKNRK